MAISYLSNIDLNQNQLQNPVIHVLASAPSSPTAGQMYYNSTQNRMYFYDGSSFIDASGDIKSVQTSTSNQLSITDENGPNPSLAIVTGAVTNSGTSLATGDQIFDFVSTQIAAISLTVSGTANEVEITGGADVNNGDTVTIGLPDNVTITNDLTVSSDLGVSGDATISGNLIVNGSTTTVNSNTVTIDDPIFTLGGDTAPSSDDSKDRGIEFQWHTGSAAKLGFFGFDDSEQKFTFIPDSTNSSEVFSGSTGDVKLNDIYLDGSIKSVDGISPVDGGILIGNSSNGDMELSTITPGEGIDVTSGPSSITISAEDATESNKGIVELATDAEALSGTETEKAVTPANLAARSYVQNIGDGTNTSYTVTHSLNTRDVIVQLYDNSTYDTVFADVVRTNTTTVTITFSSAPSSNDIRVLVTKVD